MDTVVSIGMIINELVTNSLKYAFSNQNEGTVHVELHENRDTIQLSVADNGPGISEDIDVTTVKSFGYKMIRAFAQKLKAKMTIESDEGTKVQLIIPKK
jgi:two-component sensor histidine kinase